MFAVRTFVKWPNLVRSSLQAQPPPVGTSASFCCLVAWQHRLASFFALVQRDSLLLSIPHSIHHVNSFDIAKFFEHSVLLLFATLLSTSRHYFLDKFAPAQQTWSPLASRIASCQQHLANKALLHSLPHSHHLVATFANFKRSLDLSRSHLPSSSLQ